MSKFVDISKELLTAVRNKDQKLIKKILDKITNLSYEIFKTQIKNDSLKKAFWINIYNAYYQILKKENKKKIYQKKYISFAGLLISLDDIEHSILRKGNFKYGLGYIPKLLVSKKIKALFVEKLDHRIHFALNCGSESCPIISLYSHQKIDEQLEHAEIQFLKNETKIDHNNKIIKTSRILWWFIGDFGGRKKIKERIKILFDIKQNLNKYKINFKKYSWKKLLDYYDNSSFKKEKI